MFEHINTNRSRQHKTHKTTSIEFRVKRERAGKRKNSNMAATPTGTTKPKCTAWNNRSVSSKEKTVTTNVVDDEHGSSSQQPTKRRNSIHGNATWHWLSDSLVLRSPVVTNVETEFNEKPTPGSGGLTVCNWLIKVISIFRHRCSGILRQGYVAYYAKSVVPEDDCIDQILEKIFYFPTT